jgi:mRNA interferase YafQ
MYRIARSKKYGKDFRRLEMSGRFNQKKLDNVIDTLAGGFDLPPSYRNHPLHGRFAGAFGCHIEPDLVLVYKKLEDILVLYLIRVGSHSDLF